MKLIGQYLFLYCILLAVFFVMSRWFEIDPQSPVQYISFWQTCWYAVGPLLFMLLIVQQAPQHRPLPWRASVVGSIFDALHSITGIVALVVGLFLAIYSRTSADPAVLSRLHSVTIIYTITTIELALYIFVIGTRHTVNSGWIVTHHQRIYYPGDTIIIFPLQKKGLQQTPQTVEMECMPIPITCPDGSFKILFTPVLDLQIDKGQRHNIRHFDQGSFTQEVRNWAQATIGSLTKSCTSAGSLLSAFTAHCQESRTFDSFPIQWNTKTSVLLQPA